MATDNPILQALVDLCQAVEKQGLVGPAYERAVQVLRDNVKPGGSDGPDGEDTARLDWFEQESSRGWYPALLSDDAGRWAVSQDGIQDVPDHNKACDIGASFFVQAGQWKPTVREAIDAARHATGER